MGIIIIYRFSATRHTGASLVFICCLVPMIELFSPTKTAPSQEKLFSHTEAGKTAPSRE